MDADSNLGRAISPRFSLLIPFCSLSLSIRLTCNSEIIARMLSQLNAEKIVDDILLFTG